MKPADAPFLAVPGPGPAPAAWPPLREELRLHHGPADAQGQPSWTLQDPVRHRFLRIDWLTYEVLRRWWLADATLIADEVSRGTTLHVTPDDVREVLALAQREALVHPSAPPPGHRAAGGPGAALRWLLHHYLFFRVPLWRPDAFLARLLPLLAWLGGPAFTAASLFALLAGALGVAQQAEALGAQWLDLLSWRGLALYGLTLAAVKFAHELGHALVAKHQGLRVPTMGVAFMVLWPVAYTDTTEAWRLADARARRRIAAAGVRTELTIAAWATLAWCWLPDGPLRTAAFLLGTTTWVSTVVINLSPFMRFDGYFLLCDALDMPNLHERSFALARWWLRRGLLGWQAEPPEAMSPPARRAMVAFALATWAWRLALYLGIAWMVYQVGFKLLGIVLFAVEFGWFIAAPLWRELAVWHEGRAAWRGQPRARWSAAALALAVAAGFVPLAGPTAGAALLQPAQHLALRLPAAALIDELPVKVGQAVKAGQPLLRTASPALRQQQDAAQARIQQLEREVAAAALGSEQQAQWHSLQAALATAREQAEAAARELARLQPVAPFDAVVVDVHPELRAGAMSPPATQTLMHLASPTPWRAAAYVDEATAAALRPGDAATVMADAAPLRRWPARVASVAPHASTLLAEPLLARANGGAIDARETPNGWLPTQSLYRVELMLDEPPALGLRSWRGHAVFRGEPLSAWQRVWQWAAAAAVRESGF